MHFYFDDGALTLYGRPFQGRLSIEIQSDIEVLQPHAEAWFRLIPVRSPLLRESLFDFFSSATEMFHFAE